MFKSALKRLGWYDSLKTSFVYDLYLHVARPELIKERREEVQFYKSVLTGLTPGARIFDVGANEGNKAEVFRRLGASVVCVDPDRRNVNRLRRRFKGKGDVTIVDRAVSRQVGRVTFNVFEEGSPFNTLSTKWVETLGDADKSRFDAQMKKTTTYEVETTTLDELLDTYGEAFFIKVDVEGHEAEVLAGLSRKVKFLSFELNLPEFKEEGLACVKHLTAIDPAVMFNYAVTESKLEVAQWQSAKDFAQWLGSTPLRCMDVYARFTPERSRPRL